MLLPRLFPLPLLIRGWLITSVVPARHPLIETISGGYIGIMPPGLAIFSSSVNVSGGAEVLLFPLWKGIAAFTGLLCLLWALPLSGEFHQLPWQALIDETKCLHLVARGVKSFESFSWLSAINVVLLVLRPRGVSVTHAHVSSRYHQSLRNQLICKGIVVPTDSAKLMVLVLSVWA